MVDKISKKDKAGKSDETEKKRLSKGQRKHTRRVKQEARKTITVQK
jgi:hypothetical protein